MTYSKDLVIRVLYHFYKGVKVNQLAQMFKINEKTIYNWRQLYPYKIYDENLKEIEKKINHKKCNKLYNCMLTDEIREYINSYISKNQLIVVKKFTKHLRKKFKIMFAQSTLYKWFAKMDITYKKVNKRKTFVCNKKEKLLNELYNKINKVEDKNNIISIDESNFQLNMIQDNGWQFKGKKIFKNTYVKQRNNVSLLMAINKNKVVDYIIKPNAIKATDYLEFIKKINKDENIYLMDNARIHHSKIFKSYIKTQKSQVIYNVPYNPETNPIEHVFSVLKSHVKNYNTYNEINLKKSIIKSIKKVNSDHLNNFYKYSLNI